MVLEKDTVPKMFNFVLMNYFVHWSQSMTLDKSGDVGMAPMDF